MNRITLLHPMLLALTWVTSLAQETVRPLASQPAEVRYPVILSSRWFHPASPQDTLSTLEMIDAYQPDRIDWMYCTNDTQLALLRARHIPYSLALNPQVPDSAEFTVRGRVVDLQGNKLVAPWMRKWNQKNKHWGCVNSPEFKAAFYAHSRKLIDLGAYGLFVDDARFNDHAMEWGGCFCEHCVKGFATYLHATGVDTLAPYFNYRDYLQTTPASSPRLAKAYCTFQTVSVLRFLTDWREAIIAYAARPVTFLTNNYGGRWNTIYAVFDVGIGEITPDQAKYSYITSRVGEARKLGKKQYFILSSDSQEQQLKAIYITYSAGSALVIPWDVYINNSSINTHPQRLYARTDIFVNIYNEIRLHNAEHKSVKIRNLELKE